MSNHIVPQSIVKSPHQVYNYTEEQITEFVKCAEPINGPKYFMDNYFYIQHPTKGKMLYHPFEYQKRLIDVYHQNRFSISLMPRQTGKTTSAAGYLLWYGMFIPDSTILIAAHKYTGAQEIMQRVRYAYELCPDFIRAGVTSYNKGSIDFENGSRIVSQTTTETTGRGMSITLLYCDEFAFVRPTIAKEFWTSISPTLSTGGKAIITSTPNSDEDQFAHIWKQANKKMDEYGNERPDGLGINGFRSYQASWWEHPDRDEQWKKEEIGRIGEERFRREHGCEFLIYDETLINSIKLSELEPADPIEKQGQVRWYQKPKRGKTYVLGLDPSLGTGGDPAAIQVFELPSMIQVAEWQHNTTPIQRQIVILKEICEYLYDTIGTQNDIYYSVENNTLGEAALVVIAEIGEENIKGLFLSQPHKIGQARLHRKGFTTTNKSKITVCAKLKNLIENNKMIIRSKNLISELKTFVATGPSFAAKLGETDDLVTATLLVLRMIQSLQSYDSDLDERMKDSEEDYIAPMPFILI
ncbi:large terminase protein [uncultured Caudovirales phage]|uniref:Large terminase protein n=1 Tax=uncultured Caudovirales phage TaxID=2100421 RepID=A0A6J5LMX8_9CAUD|nr:large terminase protein [uncultured Caudovirales phage]